MRRQGGITSWVRGAALGGGVLLALPLIAVGALGAETLGSGGPPGAPGWRPPGIGCAPVGRGATGAAVADLQAAMGAGADGDFGPLTERAVRAWQAAQRLAPTGTVDGATWASLPISVAARACGAPVRLPTRTPGCATLSRGQTGAATAAAQLALGSPTDGNFGPMTQRAVLALQRRFRLAATGRVDAVTFAVLGLVGSPACLTGPARPPRNPAPAARPTAPPSSGTASAVLAVEFARRQLGVPYRWGGTGRGGYDCSGLILASYRAAGLQLDRTAAQQYAEGSIVALRDLRPGDLVFYASNRLDPTTTYHDALYVGGGKMIEAAHPGSNVREVALRTGDLLPHAARPTGPLALPVRAGSTPFATRQVQARLAAHGYRVVVDGDFGARTADAVRRLQLAARLPVTGAVDSATWWVLTH